MGRKVDVEDLVGVTEIAHRLGLRRRQVVHNWIRRYDDFPPPVARLTQGLVWSWPDVERWVRSTGRFPHDDERGRQ